MAFVKSLAVAGLLGTIAAPAAAEPVEIYAAGSLRAVVAELAAKAAPMGITVHATFDGAGALRARIEQGATPDLFLSADMAAPRALSAAGRTVLPAIAFARNRLCLVAPRAFGLTPGNMLDTLLAPATRIRTSMPKADPSGDYAMALFDRLDALRPGVGATLRAKAAREMADTVATSGQNMVAALFLAHRIDVTVTYCSASPALLAAVPDLASVAVPDALDPHPVYGAALLSKKPDAARLTLLLLSDAGQEIVAKAGLIALSPQD